MAQSSSVAGHILCAPASRRSAIVPGLDGRVVGLEAVVWRTATAEIEQPGTTTERARGEQVIGAVRTRSRTPERWGRPGCRGAPRWKSRKPRSPRTHRARCRPTRRSPAVVDIADRVQRARAQRQEIAGDPFVQSEPPLVVRKTVLVSTAKARYLPSSGSMTTPRIPCALPASGSLGVRPVPRGAGGAPIDEVTAAPRRWPRHCPWRRRPWRRRRRRSWPCQWRCGSRCRAGPYSRRPPLPAPKRRRVGVTRVDLQRGLRTVRSVRRDRRRAASSSGRRSSAGHWSHCRWLAWHLRRAGR